MDFHFLIRNGISGGIFLALVLAGIWVVSPNDAAALLAKLKDAQSLVVAAVAAATPVIGICLQCLVLFYRYSRQGMFTDDARRLVAERFREAVNSDENWRRSFGAMLDADSKVHDRVFVSIYHRTAPLHLIEWARRRRSYNYLGETCALAALIGFLVGLLTPAITQAEIWKITAVRFVVVADVCAIWIAAAFWLAHKMKQDADRMELAWAIYEMATDLGQRMRIDRVEAPLKSARTSEPDPPAPAAGRSGARGNRWRRAASPPSPAAGLPFPPR